jgi:uncharacterized damage-inducible protein DinB
METKDPRYPIGRFKAPEIFTSDLRKKFIKEIDEVPANLRKAVEDLNNEQLNTPYRQNGWTISQVVHHLPDSHLNAYLRIKLALTENEPLIKTYEEDKWAELKDSFNTPVSVSLNLLDALHKRWVNLMRSLSDSDFKRKYRHPDHGLVDLDWAMALYAWHGKHHVAHITTLREKMGWD